MVQLRFIFARGGELVADLNDKTPATQRELLRILPVDSELRHTRWCGREVFLPVVNGVPLVQENQTGIVSKFDVAYWREWEAAPGVQPAETLSFYYGAERLQFHGGLLTVNVIGRIRWEQEAMLDEIGERIWRCGFEAVRVERISE